MTNEHPILFTPAHVRAILAGTKTQTRRVIKPQPVAWRPTECEGAYEWRYSRTSAAVFGSTDGFLVHCPYGAPGDLLWVREAWDDWGLTDPLIVYRADDHPPRGDGYDSKWRSPMFMPRWAARLVLRITEVRVERVQDISERDAQAEGCKVVEGLLWRPLGSKEPSQQITHRKVYEGLWDSINAKRGYPWDSNPWVWAITFEVLR